VREVCGEGCAEEDLYEEKEGNGEKCYSESDKSGLDLQSVSMMLCN
jgi:hypothetical protein